MESCDTYEALRAERARRRRMLERAETQRWVHHAADLDRGELLTTQLDRPITPLSRVERLAELGHRFDATIFGGPSQRLTPRHHYRDSPEAWLEATSPSSYAPVGETDGVVWWDPPRHFEPPAMFGMYFRFAVAPVGPALASVSVAGYAFENTEGLVILRAYGTQGPGSISFPVDRAFGVHTVDFTFVPPAAPQYLEIVMEILPGIEEFAFTAISLASQPLVIHPAAAQQRG